MKSMINCLCLIVLCWVLALLAGCAHNHMSYEVPDHTYHGMEYNGSGVYHSRD